MVIKHDILFHSVARSGKAELLKDEKKKKIVSGCMHMRMLSQYTEASWSKHQINNSITHYNESSLILEYMHGPNMLLNLYWDSIYASSSYIYI